MRHVNDFGATAISEAAVVGDTEVIRKLLEAGADAGFRQWRGQTALMVIARTAMWRQPELLLKGANVNAIETSKRPDRVDVGGRAEPAADGA